MRIGSIWHSLLMSIAGAMASVILAAGSARAAPRAQADLVEFEKADSQPPTDLNRAPMAR